jgi:hypothetical protein
MLLRDVRRLSKRLTDLAPRHPAAVRLVVDKNTKLLNEAFRRRHEKADLRPRPPTAPWLALVNALQAMALLDPMHARACIATTIITLTRMLAGIYNVATHAASDQQHQGGGGTPYVG